MIPISRSFMELVKCRWREFRREPSAFFFVLLMPVVWMLILGVAIDEKSQPQTSVGIAIDTFESDPQSNPAFNRFTSEYAIAPVWQNQIENLRALKRSDISLMISKNKNGDFEFTYDPSRPKAAEAKRHAHDLIQRSLGRKDVSVITERQITDLGSRYIDFLIPGLLALSLFTTSLFGTGMTIVANRRENLLKRYLATPMRTYEYIASHVVGRYLIAGIEFFMVMSTGFLFFGFTVNGSWLEYIAFTLLGAAAFTSLGILFGSRTSNSAAYNGVVNLVTMPMMLLAGVWFSRGQFPDWLATFASFLPLTALVDGLRKIALEGFSIWALWFEAGVLLAYTAICSLVSLRVFKWY